VRTYERETWFSFTLILQTFHHFHINAAALVIKIRVISFLEIFHTQSCGSGRSLLA